MQLRDYQRDLKDDIYRAWDDNYRAVCAVSPTGSGKTVLMGSVAHDMMVRNRPGVIIAHRTELVGQISLAVSRFGIPHNIIGPSSTVAFCIRQQINEVGRKFHDSRGMITVAAVDTLNARAGALSQWFADQTWWMTDECHHLLSGNKWGKAVDLMPNALGLGVTATPVRADNRSLHIDQGGVFDTMVLGPTMRDLINRGALCDYRIFAPPQSIDTSGVTVGSTGDYSQPGLRAAAHKSQIVGDVVSHYLKLAPGLRGITFTVDVEQANQLATAFNEAGVRAAAVSAKTPDGARQAAIDKFRKGKLLQLVNVDLFGEGFDVPAVEVVSMARPTMSYGLYVQQFGRALRTLDGKTHGIIIDHVGNVVKHGLPDAPRKWSLYSEERGKRAKPDPDLIPLTTCVECIQPYERFHRACPHCGHVPEPAGRGAPEQVDGDLIELDPSVLAQMRGEVERIDGDPQIPAGATGAVEGAIRKRWRERQEAQATLRHTIAVWAGRLRDRGAEDSEIYRRFYLRFGTDIMSAQAMSAGEARGLTLAILTDTSVS